ncbi:MAG: hypothetical protein WCP06_04000 [Verrucomicrobiota bacterium]
MHFKSNPWRSLTAALVLVCGAMRGTLDAQSESEPVDDSAPAASPSGETPGSPNQAADNGVPYSTLFQKSGAPLFGTTSLQVPGRELSGQGAGENLSGDVHLSVFDLGQSLLGSTLNLETAHLKLGPVYFHVDSVKGSVFHREGVIGSQHFSDWNSLIDLQLSLAVQLGETGNIGLTADVFYFPLDNKLELMSYRAFELGLGLLSSLSAQAAYTVKIDEWPITFADDLRAIRSGFLSSSRSDLADLRAAQGTGGPGDYYEFGSSGRQNQGDFVTLSNVVSAMTRRDLGEWAFSARGFHENLWYFASQNHLPNSREEADFQIQSVRENLRFKPFAKYTLVSIGNVGGVDQTVRMGVGGPVTDQIQLETSAGYFVGSAGGRHATAVGNVNLVHVIGPYTTEAVSAGRELSMFNDLVVDYTRYHINQILGPSLTGRLFAQLDRSQNNAERVIGGRETRTGAELRYYVGSKIDLDFIGMYLRSSQEGVGTDGFSVYSSLYYTFTESLSLQIGAHYRLNDSETQNARSKEVLGFVNLRKAFR